MKRKCLYCYKPLAEDAQSDLHEHCSLGFFGTKTPPVLNYTLDQMAELAKNVVERSITIPGVQPKISLSLINQTLAGKDKQRLTVVGALGGNYILKPPTSHFAEMPENEHVTMRIAEIFGIRTVRSSLIRLASGELAYITKRVDRTDTGEKIHMLDMFQITEAFDKYRSSMERVGRALDQYSANTLLDKLYFLDITLFCFISGNNDMHLKNFSMINNGTAWVLSPAYDLLNASIANPKDDEELALTLEGKKKKLQRQNFEHLGKGLDLNDKQIQGAFHRLERHRQDAVSWINNSFLSDQSKGRYLALLDERYIRLGIKP